MMQKVPDYRAFVVVSTRARVLHQEHLLVFLLVPKRPMLVSVENVVLTDMTCRNAKAGGALYKLSDGGGLQLWVQPNGAKLWRLAYRFGGKQKLLAVGPYPVISLADARRVRDDAKRTLALGGDPSQARGALKAAQASGEATFRAIAEEYVAKLKREGRADTTLTKIEWLLSFAYPLIGDRNIKEITPADVLATLRTVEQRGLWSSEKIISGS